MDGAPIKRGRGRPRKNPPQPIERDAEPESETSLIGGEFDSAELEAELQRAMDAPDTVDVVNRYTDDDPSTQFVSKDIPPSVAEVSQTKAPKVKKMTSTTRKMLKFGYTQVLRFADPITQGRVPGEKMAYIIANDEAAETILDEILNEMDQKYKIEQYMNPESKLIMFTAQLLLQARASSSSSQGQVS